MYIEPTIKNWLRQRGVEIISNEVHVPGTKAPDGTLVATCLGNGGWATVDALKHEGFKVMILTPGQMKDRAKILAGR